jgi:predicted MPP superfamily phosphohydrolase
MKRRFQIIWALILGLILVVDTVVFLHLERFLDFQGPVFPVVFWTIPAYMIGRLIYLTRFHSFYERNTRIQKRYFNYFGLFVLFYIPKLVVMVMALAGQIISGIADLVSFYSFDFDWVTWVALGLSVSLFVLILYGIVYGRFHFKRERHNLYHPGVPESFEGFRIVHISDLHIGSWTGHARHLRRAVDLINREEPDLIVFTGDLFNNFYEELEAFKEILSRMKAKAGKYAVLGNHDYGDYFHWESDEDYRSNFENIKKAYRELGFRLLCNESDQIERAGHYLGIAGVENWGLPPFHQYGNLQQALTNLNGSVFNVLLSHDPSHWSQEVLQNGQVHLTLSGHTHGMQFGIYTPRFKWSPSKAKYREWGGWYSRGERFLYVNKGIGYIGFPGRIGIRPEITVITLRQKKGTA